MSFRLVFLLAAACVAGLVTGCQAPQRYDDGAAHGPGEPAGAEEPDTALDAPPPTLAELAAEAERSPHDALLAMDRAEEAHAESPAFWMLYGDTTLRYFDERVAAGRMSPALAHDLARDALEAYERTLALGDEASFPALHGLARAHRAAGDGEAAWDAARRAWEAYPAWSPGADAEPAARLRLLGRIGLERTIAALQAGEPVPAAAAHATEILETAVALGDREAIPLLADLHAWQGLHVRAADVLQRGLVADPEDTVLYDRLRNVGEHDRNLQVSTLERVRQQRPGNATALWYLGEALYLQGREARAAADFLKAMESWDRAEEAFLQARHLRDDFAATCREWLHLVRTQRGWTLRDEGRISDAAATFASALEADPDRLEEEPAPQSLHLGIDAVTADFYRAGDLKAARAFLRRVLQVHDENADWLNNLGFFTRDLGVAAQEAGDVERAQQYFEESWDAYSRAVELAPQDPRIVNDRALIAVYYLDEHWGLAERELHRAIDLGTARLDELGPDVPQEERWEMEEAVGDAWENLAYLHLVRYEEIGDSAEYLRNSVRYYPYEQRDGVQRLRAVLEELRRRES